ILRHEARAGETAPELSGHYHPKLRVNVRNRHIVRPCAVLGRSAAGAERMILPAFGTLTGGLDAGHPEILGALQPARRIEALMPAAGKIARFPLWQAAAQDST
ncbi:MAG: phosphoesterase, partial [Erythrobacter sp.]|nr:phosphoesterase [Erythrobacter sp.]